MRRTSFSRLRYGWLSSALLIVLAVLLLLLNVAAQRMEKQNGWRIDFSFNAVTTYGERTREILSELQHTVHIYALFTAEDAQLMELLDRYQAASPMISWEKTSLSLNPGLAVKFSSSTASGNSVNADSIIVYCPDTDRSRILSPLDFVQMSYDYDAGNYQVANLVYESQLTSAIVYVTRDTIPVIHILQGHGELQQGDLTLLQELLELNNYQVDYLILSSQTELPAEELIMVLSPTRDLPEEDFAMIANYCSQGGRLFITCDFSDPLEHMPNWTALLRSYGFLPKDGIVTADTSETGTYYSGIPIFLLPEMASTDATIDLVSAGADTLLLPGSRGFSLPGDSDRNLTVRTVLISGKQSYLRDLEVFSLDALDRQPQDEGGPFALALQATRVTEAGEISKAFILGCSSLLLEEQVQQLCDAQEFIITMVQYLIGSDRTELDILPKVAMRPQLSAKSMTAGAFALVILPLLTVAVALIVLVARRQR